MKGKFRFRFIPQQKEPEKMEFIVFRIGKILPVATLTKTINGIKVKTLCDEDIGTSEEIEQAFKEKYGCS